VINQYYGDYITVAVFIVIGAVLVGGAVAMSKMIAPKAPGGFKDIAYESGIEPIGGGWSQSHIRYYIFALLFLIFDVEAVFIFPWAIQLPGRYNWSISTPSVGVYLYSSRCSYLSRSC